MSISSALNNANSGLAAAARRADIASSNLANALTPGYVRRELVVSERVIEGVGAGLKIAGVERANDPALTRERRLADGAAQYDRTVAAAHASFNDALGEPEDSYSLFAQYQRLETALRNLAETPESYPIQAETVEAAKALATSFNELSAEVRSTREAAERQIAESVDFVNSALKQIEKLNTDISAFGLGGRDVSALMDQRKTLIDKISAIIPVREVPASDGKVDVVTMEGAFLLNGHAKEISFTQTGVIPAGVSYDGGLGLLSGLSVDGIDITPGGAGVFSIREGSIAGHFAVRDEIAPGFQTKIDALAADVIQRFEGLDPTLAVGDPGLFTDAGAPYDPLNEIGLAGRIAVNAAVDPAQNGQTWRLRDGLGAATAGVSGDATLIQSLLDSFTAQRPLPAGLGLAGSMSAAGAAAGVSSTIGIQRISAETRLASSAARADAVLEAEQTATAVDTDREMQSLLLIERAYAANARVLQTAQAMMDVLMEL